MPGLILSATARAGLTGFLKTLAVQVAADGITVNSLQPGLHATDRLRQLYGGDPSSAAAAGPDRRARPTRGLRRASPRSSAPTPARFVTGSAILVDGGAYLGLQYDGLRDAVPHGCGSGSSGGRVRPCRGPSRTSSRWSGSRARRSSGGCSSGPTSPGRPTILLGILGASDWVDGWIARRYDQGSELGKILDPAADRVLFLVGCARAARRRQRPALVRHPDPGPRGPDRGGHAGVGRGGRAPDRRAVGRQGGHASASMFSLPAFLAASITDGWFHDLLRARGLGFAIPALVLSYYAAARYVPEARRALREGRASRGVPRRGRRRRARR